MASDDHILEGLAKDGKMDYAEWPGLLERIVPRLKHIVYNDFPIPSIPLPEPLSPLLKQENKSVKSEPRAIEELPQETPTTHDSPSDTKQGPTQKETISPKKRSISPKPDHSSVKRERTSSPAQDPRNLTPPPSMTMTTIQPPPNTLPPPLLSLLQTIQSTLLNSFPTSPPHTAQRLAELILHPRTHYNTLPSYLRALDRIVSVASPASIFPLPTLAPPTTATTNGPLLNGSDESSGEDGELRDMDFIGGAELTEIPWLRNNQNQITENGSSSPGGLSKANASNAGLVGDLRTESTRVIDGPNGAGSVETVTVNVNGVSSHSPQTTADSNSSNNNTTPSPSPHGLSQGEILRQEQEAGIVPVPSPAHRNNGGRITRSGAAAAAAANRAVLGEPPSSDAAAGGEEGTEPDTEPVHARGPDVVGVEDMGPQALGSGLEGGIELEGALGRRGEVVGIESDGMGEGEKGDGGGEKEKEKDGDGDVVVADADGVVDGEERRDRSGEEKEVDTIDADGSTL
ncbi:hypothetical protein JMJ35_008532 [Cladonia borealis]|uniref:Uncharacterized protein n=1 Tax=Cladonia borealis TaxID=184061 RepID=A0AA39QVF4_9LECA|nr:hypothetical protein JMJ35_008532 [Cladonia borealis]